MNCKQLIICKKPESNLPCCYDNVVAEKANQSQRSNYIAPFHDLSSATCSIGANFRTQLVIGRNTHA